LHPPPLRHPPHHRRQHPVPQGRRGAPRRADPRRAGADPAVAGAVRPAARAAVPAGESAGAAGVWPGGGGVVWSGGVGGGAATEATLRGIRAACECRSHAPTGTMRMNLIRYALFAALAATCLPDASPAQRAGALRVAIAAETPMSDRTPIRRLDAGVEGTYSWVGAIATGLPAGIAVFTSTDPEQHGVG